MVNPTQGIQHMIATSGTNASRLALDLGKSRGYISEMVARNKNVGASTLAESAGEMGYELLLRGHDEEIVIDGRAGNADR